MPDFYLVFKNVWVVFASRLVMQSSDLTSELVHSYLIFTVFLVEQRDAAEHHEQGEERRADHRRRPAPGRAREEAAAAA